MALVKKITGEQPFQVEASNFAVSPSTTGYTLEYSADGANYTAWPDATPADETLVVAGGALGMYYKLTGNTDEVTVTY